MEDERAAGLVDAIYATVRSPESWNDVVRDIGIWLGADCGFMMSPSIQGAQPLLLSVFGFENFPALAAYPKYAGRAEFTKRALATGRAPGAFLLDELMTPAEQSTSEFWREVVVPAGLTSGIFGMLRTPDDGDRPVILNYFRQSSAVAFTLEDTARMETLFPHLRRALRLVLDAPPRRELPPGSADLYDSLGAPCFLLNEDGAVVHGNPAASDLAGKQDGLSIVEGRLRFEDGDAQQSFEAALVKILDDGWTSRVRMGREFLAQRAENRPPLIVVIAPVTPVGPIAAYSASVRCAVLVLEEALRGSARLPERLRRLYGLTAAESEIAIDVSAGKPLGAIACDRGTTLETVRKQLKIAMGKVDVHRQTELAALVGRLRF